MGKLYVIKEAIEKTIADQKLDRFTVLGQIGFKSGQLLSLLRPETPDDPAKIEKLQQAAREVLGISL
jgi:hypothetical protein